MIVGGYTLDLYCDHPRHAEHSYAIKNETHPDQYTGETGSECRAKARRRGWKLDLREGQAICPYCGEKFEAVITATSQPTRP